ncbi:UNVERIFIED_CONTAM: hypothetical protein HDU68_005141, partial [Siphonaria sp. JEL0065]
MANDDLFGMDESSNEMAALIDLDAKSDAAAVLLKSGLPTTPQFNYNDTAKVHALAKQLERICVRSQDSYISLVLGHLPYAIICSLVNLIFFDNSLNYEKHPSPVEELIRIKTVDSLLLTSPAKCDTPSLRSQLLNTDTLHQSLLLTMKSITKNSVSPFNSIETVMPAFPVFETKTGAANPCFIRRMLDSFEDAHPSCLSENWAPSKDQFNIYTDAEMNTPSVVSSLAMFLRALTAFAPSLSASNVEYGRDKVVLAGGAVSACLAPWTPEMLEEYEQETAEIALFYSTFPLPHEIVALIDKMSGFSEDLKSTLDDSLWTHFHDASSPYFAADVDLFFIAKDKNLGAEQVVDQFRQTFEAIIKESDDGLPILRTTNSVTITGLRPNRHVQLMVNVLRSPEELTPCNQKLLFSTDLDCGAFFYDGTNVYATHRSLRAFNTRTNFVEFSHLKDIPRLTRMMKYGTRGFSTSVFEHCMHSPRCDVALSPKYKQILCAVPSRLGFVPGNIPSVPVLFEWDELGEDGVQMIRGEETHGDGEDGVEEAGGDSLYAALATETRNLESHYRAYTEYGRRDEGFEYVVIPLPYDDKYDLMDAIISLSKSKDGNSRILEPIDPCTSDPEKFKKSLIYGNPGFAPLQLKHARDSATAGRLQFATSFEACYMCGVKVACSVENNVIIKPLCTECTLLNGRKREEVIDLTGKFAVVTGARIKIGRETTLRLLRSGAT